MTMRQDLIEKRPDVAKGWLNAEYDTLVYMSTPANYSTVIKGFVEAAPDLSPDWVHMSLYKKRPHAKSDVRTRLPFVMTPEIKRLLEKEAEFLAARNLLTEKAIRPEAIETRLAEEVATQRGAKLPLLIKAVD